MSYDMKKEVFTILIILAASIILLFFGFAAGISKYKEIDKRAIEKNKAEYNAKTGQLQYTDATLDYIINGVK